MSERVPWDVVGEAVESVTLGQDVQWERCARHATLAERRALDKALPAHPAFPGQRRHRARVGGRAGTVRARERTGNDAVDMTAGTSAHGTVGESNRRCGMRPARLCVVVLLACALVVSPSAALADGRVALVVGNSAYAHIGRLPGPANDAADMSSALRRLGFEVTTALDADRVALNDALRAFARRSSGTDVALGRAAASRLTSAWTRTSYSASGAAAD